MYSVLSSSIVYLPEKYKSVSAIHNIMFIMES